MALTASLAILLVSGGLVWDFLIRSSMAYYYYDNGPVRTQQMQRLQLYAGICSVVFIVAAVASIIFGVLVYRSRRLGKSA